MSCPVNQTVIPFLKKEGIINEKRNIIANTDVAMATLKSLNDYAKKTFGVSKDLLVTQTIKNKAGVFVRVDLDPEVEYQIDSNRGIYDVESKNYFSSPPLSDNHAEIVAYYKFLVEKYEEQIKKLQPKLGETKTRQETASKIYAINELKQELEKQIGVLTGSDSTDILFHAVHTHIDRLMEDLDKVNYFSLDEIKERRNFIWEFVKGTTFDSQVPSERFEGLPDFPEFNNIRGKLDALKDKYNRVSVKFTEAQMNDDIQYQNLKKRIEESGMKPGEIEDALDSLFFAQKDISFFDKTFLGINNSMQWDTIYPQLMYSKHAYEKHKEQAVVNRLIQNLKNAVGDTKDIEFVKDRDKDGKLTGYITDSYSNTWAEVMFNIRKIVGQFKYEGNAQKKHQHYKRYIQTVKANGEIIDPRKLAVIRDAYGHTSELGNYFTFSQEEMDAYAKEIIEKIGMEKYNNMVSSFTNQIETYLENLSAGKSERYLASINILEFASSLADPSNTDSQVYFQTKNGDTQSTYFNNLNNLIFIPKQEIESDYDPVSGTSFKVKSGFYNENFQNLTEKQKEILAAYREAATYFNHTYSLNKFEKLSYPKVLQEFNEQVAKNFKSKKFGEIGKGLAQEYKKYFYETGRFSVEGSEIRANYRDNTEAEIAEKAQIYRISGIPTKEAYDRAKQEVLSMYSEDTLRDMEALLQLASEQRARENAAPAINSYMETFKNIKSGKENKERTDAIQKVQGWIDRKIYGKTNAERGSESLTDSAWLTGKDSKKVFKILEGLPVLGKFINEKTPKLLSQAEKDLYQELVKLRGKEFAGEPGTTFTVDGVKYETKIVKTAKGDMVTRYYASDIGGRTTLNKKDFDEAFQKWVENKIENLGLDLTTAGVVQGIMKTTILKGLGFNYISGIFNRLEGKNSLLIMDKTGSHWKPGNADIANSHMSLFNTLKIAPKLITNQWKAKHERAKKIDAFLSLTHVLQDRKNVFDANAESSNYDLGIGLFQWSVDNPEAKNQGTIALAVAMDHIITDNQGSKVPLYDSEGNFNAFDYIDGQLVLKPQFVNPAAGINDIHDFMASDEMFLLKQKTTQAISRSQGNYDADDVMSLTKSHWGKMLATFTKWRYEHIMQRFSPGKGYDLVTGDKRARGRYLHLWDSPGALLTAGGLTAGVSFGFGLPIILGIGGLGMSKLVVKKFFKNTYLGEIERESALFSEAVAFFISTVVETLNYPLRLVNINGKFGLKYDPYKNLKDANVMTEEQANNLAAMARELAVMLTWISILLMFKAMTWDDDDDKDSDRRMLHNFGDNQINRIINSMLVYTNPKAFFSDVSKFAVIEQMFKVQDVIAGLSGDAKSEDKLVKSLLDITPIPRVLYKDRLPWHDAVEFDHVPGLQGVSYSVWTDHRIKKFGAKEAYKTYRDEKKAEITKELEEQGLEGLELEEAVKKRVRKELISKPKDMSYDDIEDEIEAGLTSSEAKAARKASQADRDARKEELKAEGLTGSEIASIMREEFRGR